MAPRLLGASSGKLLGFLGALGTGQERPLRSGSRHGHLSQDVADTRVTFKGSTFELSEGVMGDRVGTTFAFENHPERARCTMLDELGLPVDMVVTHSFTPTRRPPQPAPKGCDPGRKPRRAGGPPPKHPQMMVWMAPPAAPSAMVSASSRRRGTP